MSRYIENIIKYYMIQVSMVILFGLWTEIKLKDWYWVNIFVVSLLKNTFFVPIKSLNNTVCITLLDIKSQNYN